MISLDFYRHKTVIPARGSWEKLLHWSYSTANLEQFKERKKVVAFFAYRTIGKVYAEKNLNVG